MDGSINEHSTRETSERTLKTEQERIKHNVNLSLKEKRAKQTKRLSERNKTMESLILAQDERWRRA